MTAITPAAFLRSAGAGPVTWDVPTGVTAGMVGLFVLTTATGSDYDNVLTATGVTFEVIDSRQANNTWIDVVKATGLVAGDTITLSQGATTGQCQIQEFYQDEYDFVTASLAAATRPGSQSTCTTGSLTPAAGQLVSVVSCERTLASPTTVSSAVSSGGETVTQDVFSTDALADQTTYIGHFTASAAASRTVTVTYSSGSGNGYAAALLTEPIVIPNDGVPVDYTSATDTLTTGALFYTSATDTLATPLEVRPVPAGYASVSAMLAAAPDVFVAHRGGSLDWPEMSLHAYTQAAFWGVGALEISLAQTSDGVWFGLHDDTLDRTSGTTGVDPGTLTWADIQANYEIDTSIPGGQTAKPYMRVEELFDAYGDSHVIFLDMKSAPASVDTVLDLLDGRGVDLANRVILKSFGVSGMTIPNAAAARSMSTWGYFYEADSADFVTYAPRWTILGMEYGASQTAWDDLRAAGTPGALCLGHIIPGSAAAATAFARGADGLMVSAVTATLTRTP